jgi:hypothetical protein
MMGYDSRDRKIRRNGMYRETFRLTLKLYPFVVAVILVSFTGEFMEDMGISIGDAWMFVTFSAGTYLAYLTCILVLLRPPEAAPFDLSMNMDGWMFLRFIRRLLLLLAPIYLMNMIVYYIVGRSAWYAVHELGQPRWQVISEWSLKAQLFEYILFLILFSAFGLTLATIAADGDRGFKVSYKRTVSQFSGILGRLLIGPILLHLVGIILQLVLVIAEPATTSLLFDGWIPNIIGIALFLFQSALWAWAVVMTFWILSKAYLKAEYGAKGMQVVHRF